MKNSNCHFAGKVCTALALCSAVLLAGCTTTPTATPAPSPAVLKAVYTPKPVTIDGILDDDVWRIASMVRFSLGRNLTDQGKKLAEPGEVQVAWDDIARYNYSRYLLHKELSMAPQMPYADNHHYEEYGVLELIK